MTLDLATKVALLTGATTFTLAPRGRIGLPETRLSGADAWLSRIDAVLWAGPPGQEAGMRSRRRCPVTSNRPGGWSPQSRPPMRSRRPGR
ncbi:hypothetical protein ACTOB_002766 [Actinoplanes oblitus]|uniref:Uncharacterized protein n=1 Tax=Actinoplanes oblitus TaxID=3040509 RepID=A0ABY8WNS5_9ACTN|nr:hypothetical protein [Actinoplanes oblitus]WIM99127.1 hypothetical protein ACTOB_002766 [Actinoplanes oblitus]